MIVSTLERGRLFQLVTRFAAGVLCLWASSHALADQVRQPLPSPANNAALHYQRAILFLDAVDPDKRAILRKPIWEIVNAGTTPEELKKIDELLIAARHAIRAALVGASQLQADFGADLREYSSSATLPHVGPMSELANLVALHGLHKQAEGEMTRAAQRFVQVVRMGNHMTQQLTLAEVLEGEKILETAFHVVCGWAVECSDKQLLNSARAALLSSSSGSLSPARALGFEASVLDETLDHITAAYPDGNWAELILHAVDAQPADLTPARLRAAAKAAIVERGVPESIFDSPESFDEHIEQLRDAHTTYYDRSVSCLILSAPRSVQLGQQIHDELAPKLKELGDPKVLNPGRLAAYYAVRQAERRVAGLVLALSIHKQKGLFPAKLAEVIEEFGGKLPVNPMGGGPAVYVPTADRKGFTLSYPGTKIAGIELPEVSYSHGSP